MAGENGWQHSTWGDLATLEYGKSLKGYRERTTGYRVYGTNGPIGWHDSPLYHQPSVIVGRKGAYRGIHFAPEPFFVIDTAYYLKPKVEFDIKWAFYQLLTKDINGMDSGSAIPSTSRDDFYELPVKVPPLPEQRAIANILSSLDDKIELNRQMNETLEGIARALFKSWFVEFDPVRAKMDGRQPAGMLPEVAELFPSELEHQNGQLTPAGWKLRPIHEVIEVNPMRRLSKRAVAPYLDMKNMPTRGHHPDEWIDREFTSGTRFINGDTLFARITPCLENGKTAFVDFLNGDTIGWGSTEYIVLRPRPPLPLEFGYYLARSDEFRLHAITTMTGSSGRQRVPTDSLTQFLIVNPSAEVSFAFGELVKKSMEEIRANCDESRTLAALRDSLLPKLLSGQIRVREAERLVEQAV